MIKKILVKKGYKKILDTYSENEKRRITKSINEKLHNIKNEPDTYLIGLDLANKHYNDSDKSILTTILCRKDGNYEIKSVQAI